MPLITAERAAELGHLSVQARNERKQRLIERAEQAEALAQALVNKIHDRPLTERQRQIERQLWRVDEMLEGCKPEHFNALTQAKERLLKALATQCYTQRPGRSKRPSPLEISPIGLEPSAPAPAQPQPTPGSDPNEPNG